MNLTSFRLQLIINIHFSILGIRINQCFKAAHPIPQASAPQLWKLLSPCPELRSFHINLASLLSRPLIQQRFLVGVSNGSIFERLLSLKAFFLVGCTCGDVGDRAVLSLVLALTQLGDPRFADVINASRYWNYEQVITGALQRV